MTSRRPTVDASLDYVLGRADVDKGRIIAAGTSRGSAVAIDLASRRALAGIVVVGAFTDSTDVVRCAATWLPRWMARSAMRRSRFDNVSKMPLVKCPALIISGGRDTLTPTWMSEKLAALAAGPVTMKVVAHAPHNGLWKSPYFGLDRSVMEWLQARYPQS